MRKSTFYLFFICINASVLAFLLLFYPVWTKDSDRARLEEGRRLVRELELTDLCLFTEARYTRHITQTDFTSPFQDHPRAEEHFPSGSLVYPPYDSRIFKQ